MFLFKGDWSELTAYSRSMREEFHTRWQGWENRAGILFKGWRWTTPPHGEGVWSVLPKSCRSTIVAPRRHVRLLLGANLADRGLFAQVVCTLNPQLLIIRSNDHLFTKSLSITFQWNLLLKNCQGKRHSWAGWRGRDGKQTWIIEVKSLLLRLCPARPMVIKETCRWDPRASS